MNLYIDEMLAGMQEMLELHKQGNNIFEMKGGNLFPNIERQAMWQYARGPKHLNFTDGNQTYSFSGDLGEEDTELQKTPDVPLPDVFTNATSKGKAQVHRADPGSIYFTLQEGTKNPTYTFRHIGDSKWRAIPKRKKAKAQLAAPPYIPNVNVESIKSGMIKQLEEYLKKEADGGPLDFFNHAAGNALAGGINGAANLALAPGRIGPDHNPMQDTAGDMGMNALKSGLIGGGIGAGHHFLKRHFLNTPEENAQEDSSTALKRVLFPAAGMAGLNLAQRSLLPNYYERAAAGNTPSLLDPPD